MTLGRWDHLWVDRPRMGVSHIGVTRAMNWMMIVIFMLEFMGDVLPRSCWV